MTKALIRSILLRLRPNRWTVSQLKGECLSGEPRREIPVTVNIKTRKTLKKRPPVY